MHDNRRAVQTGRALLAERRAPLHHLVQKPHQRAQIGEDALLVVLPCLKGAGTQQVQRLCGRAVQLTVQRLQLGAQAHDIRVIRARLAVEPLPQHTGGGVDTARELRARVERVAQP